jgi:hypothetical protein
LRKNSRYRCHVRRWVERYCVRVGREKKTLYASERDEQARREWRTTIQGEVADQLVFVDESSTHVAMTPLYARTLRGTRAYGAVPRNKGANISLLAALTPQGLTAALTVEGAVDRPVFERYVEQVLIPQLTSGQTVVMDNLSVHKSARVAQLRHDHGCTLRFLPTYSPDLAPVEGGFGKVWACLSGASTMGRDDGPKRTQTRRIRSLRPGRGSGVRALRRFQRAKRAIGPVALPEQTKSYTASGVKNRSDADVSNASTPRRPLTARMKYAQDA